MAALALFMSCEKERGEGEVTMSNANGIISGTVSERDVQIVLGTAVNTWEGLCTHPNINPSSARKPVSFEKIEPLTEAEFKSIHYGFNVEQLAPISISNISNKSAYYVRPAGGKSSGYRIHDFDGYKHDVKTVCDVTLPTTLIAGGDNVITINSIVYDAADSYSLDINKVIGNGQRNMLAVMIGNSTRSYIRVFPAVTGTIHLLLNNTDLDWDTMGLSISVAVFLVDRKFVSNPNRWHQTPDVLMNAYPIITTADYNKPAAKSYTLSMYPNMSGMQYEVVGDTSVRIETTSPVPHISFIVRDKAGTDINNLKNNYDILCETMDFAGNISYRTTILDGSGEGTVTEVSGQYQQYKINFMLVAEGQSTTNTYAYVNVYLRNKSGTIIGKMLDVTLIYTGS